MYGTAPGYAGTSKWALVKRNHIPMSSLIYFPPFEALLLQLVRRGGRGGSAIRQKIPASEEASYSYSGDAAGWMAHSFAVTRVVNFAILHLPLSCRGGQFTP